MSSKILSCNKRTLHFFLESFYFFWGRIARYDGSKESRNLLKNVAIKRVKSNACINSFEC